MAQASIALGQYTNPQLLLAGATVRIGYPLSSSKNTKVQSFFDGTWYSNKVLWQMKTKDFHGFPESVKVFEKNGRITPLKGGDGIMRNKLRIPGTYQGKDVFFEFIKEPNGEINHRLFKPY